MRVEADDNRKQEHKIKVALEMLCSRVIRFLLLRLIFLNLKMRSWLVCFRRAGACLIPLHSLVSIGFGLEKH